MAGLHPVGVANDADRQPLDDELLTGEIHLNGESSSFSGSSHTWLPLRWKRLTVTSSSSRATTTWPLRTSWVL